MKPSPKAALRCRERPGVSRNLKHLRGAEGTLHAEYDVCVQSVFFIRVHVDYVCFIFSHRSEPPSDVVSGENVTLPSSFIALRREAITTMIFATFFLFFLFLFSFFILLYFHSTKY